MARNNIEFYCEVELYADTSKILGVQSVICGEKRIFLKSPLVCVIEWSKILFSKLGGSGILHSHNLFLYF
ncbi:MAG: hypothetical protein COX49_07540 [bacterium (Candidatus Stahlbacteria) CG23_combo_of_CG06-09_8_20_14_all_40_9]|nr:MAG: hypothetical protein COX49_07540 [bacterium (Candidatus Stahlbacteria) CG23_combo_of_CG06-09_8_20_14_all_40_9]